MSLHAAPTPVTNPYQRPLLSVRWMQRMPTGPIGAEARTPMTIPLNMKSRMFISIGNAKFILVSLQFLTVGKVTKFWAQSTIFRLKVHFISVFIFSGTDYTDYADVLHEYKQDLGQQRNFGQQIIWQKKKKIKIFIFKNKRESKVFSIFAEK